ncbi:uncharacterized protein BT62DRAFT_1073954 [Guyanagaster necrorhizus]|uniref:Uncharacterized protein n=1 Tax=Guyanagaster necrorhizus TaxID=856835 RepID=A0A9P7W163_9AGAR|nr:uncharacterized protein BT62DRAFT_1073954 [Guyanagaster necrorhizus MCA 3950]KAG7449486.1 hypothetical protein BT62DRAFT_1073954 [Guyanagaster necrorhizus MCA 3950]
MPSLLMTPNDGGIPESTLMAPSHWGTWMSIGFQRGLNLKAAASYIERDSGFKVRSISRSFRSAEEKALVRPSPTLQGAVRDVTLLPRTATTVLVAALDLWGLGRTIYVWNTYNAFVGFTNIADLFVSLGLRGAGYEYITLDGGCGKRQPNVTSRSTARYFYLTFSLFPPSPRFSPKGFSQSTKPISLSATFHWLNLCFYLFLSLICAFLSKLSISLFVDIWIPYGLITRGHSDFDTNI